MIVRTNDSWPIRTGRTLATMSRSDKPRIGAYCLCHMEAAWLDVNIRRMYDFFDIFSIVIGASDTEEHAASPSSVSDAAKLLSIADPEKKIRLAGVGSYKSKDDMTAIACEAMDVDVVVQLDADEFWPYPTFLAAVDAVNTGYDRVSIPHYILWGNDQYQCTVRVDGEVRPVYFSPTRVFKVYRGATLKHFASAYFSDDSQLIGPKKKLLNLPHCIWHYGWHGRDRVRRKFNFYREKRGLDMPSIDDFEKWMARPVADARFTLGPNRVNIQKYSGPPLPEELRELQRLF